MHPTRTIVFFDTVSVRSKYGGNHVARDENPPTEESETNHTHVIIAVSIIVIFGIFGFMFLSIWRRWRSRQRGSGNTRHLVPNAESSSMSSSSVHHVVRDRPPTPPLPPAIVRMQRHANSAGLSLSDVDVVSAINPFRPAPAPTTPVDRSCLICLDDLETVVNELGWMESKEN